MPQSYSYSATGGGIAGGKAVRGFPSINPHYSMFRIPQFRTHVIGYGGKVEQRIALDNSPRWSFKIRWKILNETKAGRVLDFFLAMRGAFEAFYWDNPENNLTYLVRFKDDDVGLEYFTYKLYQLKEIELLEVDA